MTAFITRDISETSEFDLRLKAAGWMVHGRSLVELSPLPFAEVPRADWIFFSSGNAVRFFFEQLKPEQKTELARVQWAALGPSTAKILAEYIGKVDFVGTGEPEETARRFSPSPGPSPVGRGGGENTVERSVDTTREDTVGPTREGTVEHSREHTVNSAKENETPEHTNTAESTAHTTEESTVSSRPPLPTGEGLDLHLLFPAARHSRQSVLALLSERFRCTHFEVYNNLLVVDPPYSDAEVLVFTSPMNAQAYFSKHILAEKQRVVAIGQTTAGALRELGIATVEVAASPDERGLAEAVLRLRW